MDFQYASIKVFMIFIVFGFSQACTQSKKKVINTCYVNDSIKKVIEIYDDSPEIKHIKEYNKRELLIANYQTINDTLDGLTWIYKEDLRLKFEHIYKMGIQHGITRYAVDNKPISHEGLIINDTIVLSKYSATLFNDSIDGKIENFGYDIFDVKDGNQINSRERLGHYILKGKKYIDIFHLKNSDIDWSKSSWFYDDLKDTLLNNTLEYFTLSSKYYHLPDSVQYLQTILALGPIDTKGELIRVNDEFKSVKGEKEIKCHIRIAEKGYQLITGKIYVCCIAQQSRDTLFIKNLFYKQVYVE